MTPSLLVKHSPPPYIYYRRRWPPLVEYPSFKLNTRRHHIYTIWDGGSPLVEHSTPPYIYYMRRCPPPLVEHSTPPYLYGSQQCKVNIRLVTINIRVEYLQSIHQNWDECVCVCVCVWSFYVCVCKCLVKLVCVNHIQRHILLFTYDKRLFKLYDYF